MKLDEAKLLAHQLMAEHSLHDWQFQWSRSTRAFGTCSYYKKTIQLSKPLTELNNPMHVVNTILHEIAHALVDSSHGHDKVWRAKAKSIGCNGERCYSREVQLPKKKVQGECPNCHRQIQKYKRTNIACGECCKKYNGNRYSDEYSFVWSKLDS